MAGAASRGGLMVRVGAEADADALSRPHVEGVHMSGRPMTGWVRVGADGLRRRRQLSAWVQRAVRFTRTLAPKG
jgi:hypothetical protein